MPRKKPKHRLPIVEVNVVSLMDILTTLLFFVILVASTSRLSAIDAEAIPDAPSDAPPQPTFTLQVAVTSKTEGFIWLGAIKDLKMVDPDRLESYLGKHYKGNSEIGYLRKFNGSNVRKIMSQMQKDLIQIKKSFPHQNRAAVSFTDAVNYKDMIYSITQVRTLSKRQRAFKTKSLVGQTEQTKVLFPLIVVSEWIEEQKKKS